MGSWTYLDVLLVLGISMAAGAMHMVFFVDSSTGSLVLNKNLLCCAGNFLLALGMAAFVWSYKKNTTHTLLAYGMTAVWPVFVADSAYAGGREVFFGLLILAGLLVMGWKKKFTKNAMLLFFLEVSLVQWIQADTRALTLTGKWPNIYLLYSETGFVSEYGITGKLFVFGALLLLAYYLWQQKLEGDLKLAVTGGLFAALFISYFLPFANYRSGFMANVLAIALFFLDPKKFYQPLLLGLISYTSFSYNFTEYQGIPQWIYGILLLLLMFDTARDFYDQIHEEKGLHT